MVRDTEKIIDYPKRAHRLYLYVFFFLLKKLISTSANNNTYTGTYLREGRYQLVCMFVCGPFSRENQERKKRAANLPRKNWLRVICTKTNGSLSRLELLRQKSVIFNIVYSFACSTIIDLR